MKKALCVVLMALLAFSLVACSAPQQPEPQTEAQTEAQTEPTTEAPTEAPTEPETDAIDAELSDIVQWRRESALEEVQDDPNGMYLEDWIDTFYANYKDFVNVNGFALISDDLLHIAAYFDKNYDLDTVGGSVAVLAWQTIEQLYQGHMDEYKDGLKELWKRFAEIKEPPLTPKQYKKKCKSIDYKKLARNPDKYEDKKIKFTGQVVQVIEEDLVTAYRINVTFDGYGYYDDTVLVNYYGDFENGRILEDDIVTVYGVFTGLTSYETVLGATMTIPSMDAEYIDLVE